MTFEENNLFLKDIELFEKLLVSIEKNMQKKFSALFRLIDLSNCPHSIKNYKKKVASMRNIADVESNRLTVQHTLMQL